MKKAKSSKKILVIAPVLLTITLTLVFLLRKERAAQEFDLLIHTVPSIKNYGLNAANQVLKIIDTYGASIGVIFGFIYFILGLIANLAFSILQINRWKMGRHLAMLIALMPILYLGWNMVYISSRFTAISSGIVLFIGYPLFYGSLITLAILSILFSMAYYKKGTKLILMLSATILLSGCTDLLSLFIEATCEDDAYHCQQEVAIQRNDPNECDKIPQHPGFSGSNPPQDKCHMMLAQNNGDTDLCDSIKEGPGSYSIEDCKASVDKSEAVANIGETTSEKIEEIVERGSELVDAGTGLSSTLVASDIQTITDAAKGKYRELLNADIENEVDPARLAGLEAYSDFLDKSGETLEGIQTNINQLNELKRVFLDSYDPSMDISNMDVNEILGPGLFDRMKTAIFRESNTEQSEEDRASDALVVYEAMLERQSEIDFLKQDRLSRVASIVTSNLKDSAVGEVTEKATELAQQTAGTAFTAITYVGDALQSFQDEAQNQIFIGLARAYDRRRTALAEERPNATPDELHRLTIEQLKDDPYQDAQGLTFIKYGNILENGECGNTSNPLCIQSDVFFTAMEQAWRYKNR